MSFDDWISYVFEVYTRNPYFLANHIRPQHEFVGPKIKKFFKYEDGLNVAIKHVLELAGVPLNGEVVLDELNTRESAVSGAGSDIAMGDETRQKIMNFYNKDFELFGYN